MIFRKLSIIVPAFNEATTISQLLSKVISAKIPEGIQKEIIVVNDASKDSTEAVVQKFTNEHPGHLIKCLTHEKNQGKGKAIRTALTEATGEYIIIQDADLEYDPDEYLILLGPVVSGQADVVYGSRFISGKAHRVLHFWHSVGNKFLTFFSNMFSNLNLTDMETCFKLFPTHVAQKLNLKENRFGFEPEITAKLASVKGIRFYEVGISYFGRKYEEGKKIGWKDGVRALFVILRYSLYRCKIEPEDYRMK